MQDYQTRCGSTSWHVVASCTITATYFLGN